MVLVHLHCICGLCGRLRLRLCGLCSPLFTRSLRLLLLLDPRCDGLVQIRIFQIHGRYERLGKLLLRDEGVKFGLLWRPPFEWIDLQQSAHKVNECNPIVQLCSCVREIM